ncbi:transcriptional regulator [Sphingobium lactosutens]|nr:transcriptional regulator [Sphingobium lactosutens]
MDVNEKFLRLSEVISKTGKSKAAIYRDVQIGAFPSPVKIGARAFAWRLSQINSWMTSPADYQSD